uniref:TIR domain-containing protein n=1 Tax=Gopherus agassizii TaxID=38772 RepID=A0A452HIF8_9SAUR
MGFPANIFIFACIFTFTLWNNIQLSMENEFTAHYSSSFLAYVPKSQTFTCFPNKQKLCFPLLYDGMNTSEKLELSNIIYNSTDFPFPPFDPLKFKTLNLRFNNVDLSWSILVRIFMIVWSTPVEYFTVKKLTFRGSVQSTTNTDFSLLSYWAQSVYSGSSMKALILDHICTKNENHCHWVRTLAKLNLSSNKLTDSVFGCLPINVQILDLQNNQIRMVPKDITELKALKELNIAFNRLAELPGCSHFRGLELLNIEENSILIPSSDFFHSCQNIRELRGGHNPFQCSCELRDFVNFEKKSGGRLVGWPESYVCEYPDDLKGTELKDFQLSELSCNTTLLLVIALVVTVVVVAVTSFLCIYFDIMWYLKMMWQWTQTKRRVRKSHPEDLQSILQFHAFISYSERDSLWVKNHLIPNLEKEDGSVQICLHERNFIPGKSIVENIINCIEKSHKSIFVLSPNFVQMKVPSLILILLEPIPQYLIPARYHKLKALMAKRTYLEWPKEKSKHGLFWANLKATLNSNLDDCGERN